MTQPVGLNLVWANAGGTTDPTDSKYQLGWVAEIPTFQNFNYVLQNLDKAKLTLAEGDVFPWQGSIAYKAGAKVVRENVVYYCTTEHNNSANANPRDPKTDKTNSYWATCPTFSSKASSFASASFGDGLKLDEVQPRANANSWEGNDLTINNKTPVIALNNPGRAYNNLLIGNIKGKFVVNNTANVTKADGRNLEDTSFEVYHEGNKPTQAEVEGTIPTEPKNGKLYGRRSGNWVVVTTTTVGENPPAPAKGAGDNWYNLRDGMLYVDINDGDSSQWVPTNAPMIPKIFALGVEYDNTKSGLSATNLQASTDELAASVVDFEVLLNNKEDTILQNRISDLRDIKADLVANGLTTNSIDAKLLALTI